MRENEPSISVPPDEVELTAVRSQGAGGQNVNKVSSAIHLRFDVAASSLPVEVKERLLALRDQRMTAAGVIVLKAQKFRTQEKNRAEAMRRLERLIESVAQAPKERKPTRPTAGSRKRRLEDKTRRAQVKALRGRVSD